MSTKHAPQKSGGQAGSKQHNSSGNHQSQTAKIPVLIRLPDVREFDPDSHDLHDEPAQSLAAPMASATPVTGAPLSNGPIASPEAYSPGNDQPAVGTPDTVTKPAKSFSVDMSGINWRRFAWQAGAAIGLIVLFVIAFAWISSGGESDGSSNLATNELGTGESELEHMHMPVDQSAQMPIDVIPKLPPVAPMNREGVDNASTIDQQFTEFQPRPSITNESPETADSQPEQSTPSETSLADSGEEALDDQSGNDSVYGPGVYAPAEDTPDESASNAGTPDVDEPDFATDQTLDSNPGIKDPAYKYPLSNPDNFQYPREYHEIYDAKFRESSGANTDSSASNTWQGNSPRLGSRMQAPPVR